MAGGREEMKRDGLKHYRCRAIERKGRDMFEIGKMFDSKNK